MCLGFLCLPLFLCFCITSYYVPSFPKKQDDDDGHDEDDEDNRPNDDKIQ